MRDVVFDYARQARIGLPEAVYCQGKPRGTILGLLDQFRAGSGHPVLFTRLAADVVGELPPGIRDAIDYHALSRTAWGEKMPSLDHGKVVVVTAGTSDSAVAWEAARTLDYLGIACTVLEDCGVAGLWRLIDRLPDIEAHDVVIVVAGLDAALASVMGGLTARPVIAVPTSVGYGVAADGGAALNSMLASCAPGVPVMNIDNGYGAACAAARMLGRKR